MATHDDTTDTTDTESIPEYDAERFVRASELRRKERYCPNCEEQRSAFTFSRFIQDEGCDGRPLAEYRCYVCGFPRRFGVLVK